MPISSLVVLQIMTLEAHCHCMDIGNSLSSQNKNAVIIQYHDSLGLHQNFLLAIKYYFHLTHKQSISVLIKLLDLYPKTQTLHAHYTILLGNV